jgi:hypothetical protein
MLKKDSQKLSQAARILSFYHRFTKAIISMATLNSIFKIPLYPPSPIKSFEDKFPKEELISPSLAKRGQGRFGKFMFSYL